jgi:hypothetical protein
VSAELQILRVYLHSKLPYLDLGLRTLESQQLPIAVQAFHPYAITGDKSVR